MNRRARGAIVNAAVVAIGTLTACGGGSSGPSSNPVPAIAALSPNSASREGPAFTLTVTGSGVTGVIVEEFRPRRRAVPGIRTDARAASPDKKDGARLVER